MNQSPKVSIIVPVYNAEKYIIRCLNSIQNQTFRDYEVVIVNDGSTDQSISIIMNFIDDKSNWYLHSKINEGPALTRNFALEQVKGEYICFVDIDDFVEKDYIEKLYNALNNSECKLACCGYIDHSDYGVNHLNNYDNRSAEIINANEFSQILFTQIGGVLWDKMFCVNIIKNNNLRMNCSIYYYEDSLFILDYIKFINSICILEQSLYNYYRINEASFTNKIDYTWVSNVIRFNKEREKKMIALGVNKIDSDKLIHKSISSFLISILNYEKLKKNTYQENYKIIRQIVNESYFKVNFKPHYIGLLSKIFVFLLRLKMIRTIIVYSYTLSFLKKNIKIIRKGCNG